MDVMLQRHCARYIYVIPEGLRELMSDISREVLRSQPEQIYTFIADYLDALLITRENARVAAKFVESITQIAITIVELLVRTGMNREDADRVCTIVQEAFRRHLAIKAMEKQAEQVEEANVISEILDEADMSPEQAESAASIIQAAYRDFKSRQEKQKELLTGMIDWRVAARSAIQLYRRTGVTNEEAQHAATLIKAAYKGYYTRRMMRRLVEEGQRIYSEEAPGEDQSLLDYLRMIEMQHGEDYDVCNSDQIEKSVRINYDTVIPHVDFSDAVIHIIKDEKRPQQDEQREKEGTEQPSEESKEVALKVMEGILGKVVPDESDNAIHEQTEAALEPIAEGQETTEETQEDAEEKQEAAGDAQEAAGDAQEAAGDAQEAAGDAQEAVGEAKEVIGETQVSTGETQEVTEEAQEATEEAQEATEGAQEVTEEAQEVTKETQEVTETAEEVTDQMSTAEEPPQ